jgi:NADH:ubiquinone oxidoreductase subunit 2 (subunit N)
MYNLVFTQDQLIILFLIFIIYSLVISFYFYSRWVKKTGLFFK